MANRKAIAGIAVYNSQAVLKAVRAERAQNEKVLLAATRIV